MSENGDARPGRGVSQEDVLNAIDEVEGKILAEDKTGATRDQVVEGTCQRIRSRIRDVGGEL